MGKGNGQASGAIGTAADALDSELLRFEELAAAVHKIGLTSEKNLDRAAKGTEEVLACQERIAACVTVLVGAITSARERQQKVADDLEARAHEVRARREEYRELLEQFLGVSDEARALNTIMTEVAEKRGAASAAEGTPGDAASIEVRAQLAEAIVRMDKVAESAKTLEEEARARDMQDLRRQAESLRQQLQSAKNRVLMLQRAL